MKKLLHEFRDIIITVNVIDIAVTGLLAVAVGALDSEFTHDVMMPVIGYFTVAVDFSDLRIILSNATIDADGKEISPDNAILYGKWINTIINLIIVGFILFMIVKSYARVKDLLKKKEEEEAPAEPAGPTQEELLAEIRDLLKKQ